MLNLNERSWAIELISEINFLVRKNRNIIVSASGEKTLKEGKKSMFPDVILFGNE